jgi:hypothetical protein
MSNQYIEDFQNGLLFMNTLKYFQDLEGNEAQGDYAEGICGTINKKQAIQYGLHFDPQLQNVINDTIFIRNEYYGLNNLFCMYCLFLDENSKKIYKPSEDLTKFYSNNKDAVAIKITNKSEFFKRIDLGLEEYALNKKIEYGIRGLVEYRDFWLNVDAPGSRSAFHKSPKYSYQNEWRLCILKYDLIENAFIFDIGNLNDITQVIPLEQFLFQYEKFYPGYTTYNTNNCYNDEIYSIKGSLNSVSNLMFAYNNINNTNGYSDEAQADWHYINFLRLSNQQKEIEKYLKKRFEETSDQEHLLLLVQYYLETDLWIKATDCFAYCLNNNENIINENPTKFFFNLHTILMSKKLVEDAAILWNFVASKFSIQNDINTVMKSDWLFALGFYDKVIPTFLSIKVNSSDPILDFYLGVCYFYILDFEKSAHCLNKYLNYFAPDPVFVEKSNHLKKLLNIFKNKEKVSCNAQIKSVYNLKWGKDFESYLIQNVDKQIFIGLDHILLFTLEKKWDLLKKSPSVIVCPLTIFEIIKKLDETNDILFYNAIENIKSLNNLKIESPDPQIFLQIRNSESDCPSYISMQKAITVR